MNNFSTLPKGVRLDAWPDESPSKAPQDAPEVAQLREELRKAMPEFTDILEMLGKLRSIRGLPATPAEFWMRPTTIIS